MYTLDELNEMSNVELQTLVKKEYGVKTFPASKNTARPTKQELLTIIKNLGGIEPSGDIAGGIADMVGTKADKTKSKKKVISPKVFAKINREMLFFKKRVIISKNEKATTYIEDNDGTSDNSEHSIIQYIEWGNDDIGYYKERVIFDEPFTIRLGCLKNLEHAVSVISKQVNNKVIQVVVPTYNITPLAPFTDDEIERMKEHQRYVDMTARQNS
jgi:hypothetical protein